MNNPNPFLSQSSFLEQKNKARARLKIAVFFSISLSVVVLMALLIQGCRKNDAGTAEQTSATPTPELASNPTPDTNATTSTTNVGTLPPVESNTPPPAPPPPPPPPAPPEPTTSDYTIVAHDTFATIAKKSGVSVKAIEEANPGVDPKRLKVGQKIHVPAPSATSTPPAAGASGAPEAAPAGDEQTYKVKSGDTLTGIAKQFHTSIKSIQSANNMKTTSIRVGQTLKIPSKAAPQPEPAPETTAPPPMSAPTPPPAASTN
jgi:LysM repeat protein